MERSGTSPDLNVLRSRNNARRASSSGWLVILFSFALLAGSAPGCGVSNEASIGWGPGKAGASGQGRTAGSSGGGIAGASGTGSLDDCGGGPCADYRGQKTFIDPSAPLNAPDLFVSSTVHDPGTDPMREPRVIYPNHETAFPINVSRIRHEWLAAGQDLFCLLFSGPNTTVRVYTANLTFTPSEEQWDWIAESNRGTTVQVRVQALASATPAEAWSSKSVDLLFSDSEVEGALYYWSTGTKGVMRALVSDAVPEKFYTQPSGTGTDTCVACHTLSRDGKRLAVAGEREKLREVSVPERNLLVPAPSQVDRNASWMTFSPDGRRLLVAADGRLTLIDADTGEPVGPNAGVVPLSTGQRATHPDWSALGNQVAITLATAGGNKDVEGGSIALLPYENETWGEPQILVASTSALDNNFFPSFSPDSQWIVYTRANGRSKDAAFAALYLVSASGGPSIELKRLNERVNNADGVLGIGNSMPTWAPSTKPGNLWLAFSSLRAYGTLRSPADKADQIWIAGLNPTLLDPSYAAFWAPFQNIEDGNHRAFWTHASTDRQCSCIERCGDSLDNDCNGTADDANCVICQSTEICGDGIDNDCDCVVDECNVEICGDGLDNDGDELIDSADSACQFN